MKLFQTHICVVDDDPFYSDVLCKFLINEHFKVTRFASGFDVLDKLDKEPDIIFMDVHMDTINGLQASRILKKRWPTVNIVLISSSNDAEIFLKEKSKDYNSFEPKSRELSGMLEQIKNHNKRRRLRAIFLTAILALISCVSIYFMAA
jgi:CheY-like chemotaxis protein